MMPPSNYEQPLPIRECDAGIVTARDAVTCHGDAQHRANKKATLLKVTRFTETCTFLQKSQSKNLLLI